MIQQHKPHACANIQWRDKREIGRVMPPPGTESFALNARFIQDGEMDIFSVILYYPFISPSTGIGTHQADLYFLAPQLVLPRLIEGSKLYITMPRIIVGDAEIIKIYDSARI